MLSDTALGSVDSLSTFPMTNKKFKGGITVKKKGGVVEERS